MQMKQHESLSAFLTPAGIAEPTTPALDYDSGANDESWRTAFQAIAHGCVEFQSPQQVKIWRGNCGDELVCRINEAECLLMPIRSYGAGMWITMRVPDALWRAYRENKESLQTQGVIAMQDAGVWQLLYKEASDV